MMQHQQPATHPTCTAPCAYCDMMARELIEAYTTAAHQLAWLAELLDAARTHNRNGNHLASQELMDTAACTAADMAHCHQSEASGLFNDHFAPRGDEMEGQS